VSSVGSFFSYINDARSHEPEVEDLVACTVKINFYVMWHRVV